MSILKRIYFWSFFALLLVSALMIGQRAQAADETCKFNTKINFTARDPNGAYITNAKIEVYKQIQDADGNSKPGTRVAGASVNAVTGIAALSWRDAAMSNIYAVRVQTISHDDASFWFYDLNWSCGEETALEKTLSGLTIDLRDSASRVLTNTSFKIYTQLYDEDGSLLSEKNKLLGSFNSGVSGKLSLSLPQGSVRGVARAVNDYYVLEVISGGKSFYLYNISVTDGQINDIQYALSAIKLSVKEASGRNAVGKKVEIYKQLSDANYNHSKGTRMGEITIGDNGYGTMNLPAGEYVLSFKDGAGVLHDFWDRGIINGQTNNQTLTLAEGESVGTCAKELKFTLITKNNAGNLATGLKFEIYEQIIDASGLPLSGTKLGGATIGTNGKAEINVKPDSKKNYALKIWDKRADLGEFWFFDALKFVCGYNRQVIKKLPVLKVIIRDAQGNLKRNQSFSVLAQEYDVDSNPIAADNGLIADLKTDGKGQALIYVSPNNPYKSNQTGSYIVRTKDGSGAIANFFNINISTGKDYLLNANLSGLSGILQDASGKRLTNKNLNLYNFTGSGEDRSLGPVLFTGKTDKDGNFNFEYPAGTYAIGVQDEFKQENIFWDVVVKPKAEAQKLSFNLTSFSVTGLATDAKTATIKLSTLTASNTNTYVRGREIGSMAASNSLVVSKYLASGQYLASYLGPDNKEYGSPFYVTNGTKLKISFGLNAKYLISPDQSFRLTLPSSSSGSNPSTNSSLKGRILLQVEDKGQAWYVNPDNNRRYYLGRPTDAFNLMKRVGIGISNQDFSALESSPTAWRRLAGKILLKVEDSGRAYYFDPVTLKLHYLGRPTDAYNIIRSLGLGISNHNLTTIGVSE